MGLAKLGNVVFNVVQNETAEYVNEITIKPLEDGSNVTDHSIPKPDELKIIGTVVGIASDIRNEQLKQYRNDSTLLKFVGRNTFDNVIIKVLTDIKDNTIINGFKFHMTLQQVKIVKTEEAQIDITKIDTVKIKEKTTLSVLTTFIEPFIPDEAIKIGMGVKNIVGLFTEKKKEIAENIFNKGVELINGYINLKKKIFGGSQQE